jgi:hypothetical protein
VGARIAVVAAIILSFFISVAGAAQGRKDLSALEAKVQSLRGLKFRSPVKAEYFSAAQVAKFITDSVKAPKQAARLASEDAALKAFGLLSESEDAASVYIKLYSEQAAGLYDYDGKRLIVATDRVSGEEEAQAESMGISTEDTIIIHELDHALQDQHFDLGTLISRLERSTGDEALAGQAVFEGDATYVMMDFMMRAVGMDMSMVTPEFMGMLEEMGGAMGGKTGLANLPLYFRKVSLYPYTGGLGLVKHVKDSSGWSGVDGLYRILPASTEQVLHPEKYRSAERPLKVTFPFLATQGWSILASDTLGEFVTGIVFEQFAAGGEQAAAGWNGDSFQVLGKGGARILLWYTCWDSTGDAERFLRDYKGLLEKKHPGAAWTDGKRADEHVRVLKDGTLLYAARRDSDVVFIESASRDALWGLADLMWSARKSR